MNARWRLTRAGFLAILVAALMITAGLMKTINLLVLLGNLLLALILINAVLARRQRGIHVEAPGDHALFHGEQSPRALRVANVSDQPAAVTIRDRSDVHAWTAPVALAPGDSRTIRKLVRAKRRGVFDCTIAIESGHPFGFVAVERRTLHPGSLIVFPAIGTLDMPRLGRWLRQNMAVDTRRRLPSRRISANLAELRGVRAFRTGDSPHLIHWRTTARRGELMVREFDRPEAHDLSVIIDPRLPAGADRQRLEAMLSLAATLVWHWSQSDLSPRIMLAIRGGSVISGRASAGLTRQCLTMLAGVSTEDGPTDEGALPFGGGRPRSVRLLIADGDRGGAAAALHAGTGMHWQILSPTPPPDWYHPPKTTR